MNFGAPLSARLALAVNDVVGAERLAARPRSKGKGCTYALCAREGPQGKRGQTRRRGWKHPPADAREDRTLEVVLARRRSSLQKSFSSVLAGRSGLLPYLPMGRRAHGACIVLRGARESADARGAKRHWDRIEAETLT